MAMATQASLITPRLFGPKPWKQPSPSTLSFTSPKPLKFTISPRTIKAAAAEEKTEAPVGFTPPELEPNTPSPILGGNTGGL
ncbi:putative photosystem I reaction center subunit II, chloroplastic-like [Sesbania bispinosa]|nr:putative photosystem I reaction center subunit II, chloroplastic-like [Sesbania bispinosa]